MHLADAFIQSDLQWLTVHSGYTFIISMCVPWESNPWPLEIQPMTSYPDTYLFKISMNSIMHKYYYNVRVLQN